MYHKEKEGIHYFYMDNFVDNILLLFTNNLFQEHRLPFLSFIGKT